MMLRNAIFPGMLLLLLALGLGIAGLRRSRAPGEPPPPVPRVEINAALPPEPTPADVAKIIAANPFHRLRGRIPAVTNQAVPEKKAILPKGNFTLRGIFVFGERQGVLISGSGGKAGAGRIFGPGEMVSDQYHVKAISGRQVTLERGSETISLQLYKKTEKKP